MKRVLFIGNSHTYVNDMPFLFESFSKREQGDAAFTTMIVHGGRMLSEHLNEPEVAYNIRYGRYDYVVLQQAAHPFPGEQALLRDGGTLADWISASGAEMVGYMTWAEQHHPDRKAHQQQMEHAYTALCQQKHGILAPVGAIWEEIFNDPQSPVNLYGKDGEHASIYGSYLAACVIYAVIYQKSPLYLPTRFYHHGVPVYEVDRDQAAYLQQKAAAYLGY